MTQRVVSTLEIIRLDGSSEIVYGKHSSLLYRMKHELTQIDVVRCNMKGKRNGEDFSYTQCGDFARNGTFDIDGVGAFSDVYVFDVDDDLWNTL